MKRTHYPLLALQAASVAILLFGDIGFDKPGKYGLAFGAGIVVSVFYAIVLLMGLGVAYSQRHKWLIVLQLLPLLLFLVSLFLP